MFDKRAVRPVSQQPQSDASRHLDSSLLPHTQVQKAATTLGSSSSSNSSSVLGRRLFSRRRQVRGHADRRRIASAQQTNFILDCIALASLQFWLTNMNSRLRLGQRLQLPAQACHQSFDSFTVWFVLGGGPHRRRDAQVQRSAYPQRQSTHARTHTVVRDEACALHRPVTPQVVC